MLYSYLQTVRETMSHRALRMMEPDSAFVGFAQQPISTWIPVQSSPSHVPTSLPQTSFHIV